MQIVIAPAAASPLVPSTSDLLLLTLLSLVPAVIVYVWTALALSRVFAKVGVDGWKAWVPVYNAVVFLGLGGLSGWLLLLWLIPIFGPIFVYVAVITAAHRVGTSFGYSAGMTVLAALLFPVWASILGFGGAQPGAGRDAYSYAPSEETGEALRGLSPDFGRSAFAEPSPFEARRDVPAPSAWIPPAPGTGVEPAPAAPAYVADAPAYSPDPSPYEPASFAPAGSPWAPGGTVPPSSAPTGSVAAPPSWDAPAEPAPAEPVTSWWMPAPEPEATPAAPADAVPTPSVAPAPEPYAPASEPAILPEPEHPSAPVAPAAAAQAATPEPVAAPESAAVAEPEARAAAWDEPGAPTDGRPEQWSDRAAQAPAPVPPHSVLRDAYVPESDAFPEESGAVSAVVGAPTAGAPRAAASSVSAFRPGMSDFVDDTVIASRKRPAWALQLPDGTTVELTAETVVLGRRPAPVHSAPGAQLVTVVEETRTVSKTHALLRRQSEAWVVSDLGSTNGVVVDEVEVEPGATTAVEADFLLGDAVLRLVRRER
jgi:hypothetical protein